MLHCGTGLQGARHRVSSCTHFRLCKNIALKLYKSVKRRLGTPEHVCRQKVLLLNRKQCSSNKESVHASVTNFHVGRNCQLQRACHSARNKHKEKVSTMN